MAEGVPTRTLESMDIQRVLASLPHRYPFLMVDRVIEIDGDNSAIGVKNVTITEPHFMGHFPGQPVMPGVLIIEAMAQTAGAICVLSQGWDRPNLVYFISIDNARFRKPVVPGDVLELHVRKTRNRGNLWKYQAEGRVAGAVVAEAEIGAIIIDPGGGA
jgi:3-hydroxyacyl-[acyl-carrier-protein] dehydratase